MLDVVVLRWVREGKVYWEVSFGPFMRYPSYLIFGSLILFGKFTLLSFDDDDDAVLSCLQSIGEVARRSISGTTVPLCETAIVVNSFADSGCMYLYLSTISNPSANTCLATLAETCSKSW